MKNYVIALDQGTTSSRAIVFDRQQNIVEIAQKEFTQLYPKAGYVEHDPRETVSYTHLDVYKRQGLEQLHAGHVLAGGDQEGDGSHRRHAGGEHRDKAGQESGCLLYTSLFCVY